MSREYRVVCDRCDAVAKDDSVYRFGSLGLEQRGGGGIEADLCPRCVDLLRIWITQGR